VYTIVLTGGPCGGKSTALATLTKHLRAQGYEVYSIPEVPTLVFTGTHTFNIYIILLFINFYSCFQLAFRRFRRWTRSS
jgi:hypothetical protein